MQNGGPLSRALRPSLLLFLLLASSLPPSSASAQQRSDTLSLYRKNGPTRPIDPNGFLFNPTWLHRPSSPPDIEAQCRFRVATAHLEERTLLVTAHGKGPCLTGDERDLVSLDEAASTLGFGIVCASNSLYGNVRGHVNWFPITATGLLRWVGYSYPDAADHDLTMDLLAPEPHVLTSGNVHSTKRDFENFPGYHVEFYADETVSRYQPDDSWWYDIRRSLGPDKKMTSGVMDTSFAIVNGLYGVDGVHGFHAELHPVFAMSVHRGASAVAGGMREEWAVMVRNRGNEGDCSAGQIPLFTDRDGDPEPEQDFAVDLGWWPGATGARVFLGPSQSADGLPSRIPTFLAIPPTKSTDTGHLYLVFRQPRPHPDSFDYLFLGTINVDWVTRDNTTPDSRFKDWLPPIQGAARLASVRRIEARDQKSVVKAAARSLKIESSQARWRKQFGIEEPRPLVPLPQQELQRTALWTPAATMLKPERAAPWIVGTRIKDQCPTEAGEARAARLPLCRQGVRFSIAPLAGSHHAGWAPSIAAYVPARQFEFLGPVFGGFSYRLSLQNDYFRRRRDIVPNGYQRVDGLAFYIAPILEPVSIRAASWLVISPYSVLSVSPWTSSYEGEDRRFMYGTGVGMHTQWRLWGSWHESFLDVERFSRSGGFDGHLTVSLGLVVFP